MKKVILASASPRRKVLLEQMGLKFDIMPSNIEEIVEDGLDPCEVAKSLAYQKASDIAQKVKGEYLVIGSDTIVVIDNVILGKPKDENDIYSMLRRLSNKTHRVITGVCIIKSANGEYIAESDVSFIKFRELSDQDIKRYIESKEPFDKAGSYGIQGLGAVFIERIEGSYTGVVGLPIFLIDKMLKCFGVDVLGGNN